MSLTTKQLLIIAHAPSDNTRRMCDALLAGAQHDFENTNVVAQLKSPFDCTHENVLASDAIILFTTENFSYMSGALKDFFDRCYYLCLADSNRNEAKPFALVIKAGLDGTGTNLAVHKIVTGLKWREVQPVTLCKGNFDEHFITQCHSLGLIISASLDNDLI